MKDVVVQGKGEEGSGWDEVPKDGGFASLREGRGR